jgi:hypothetical protein
MLSKLVPLNCNKGEVEFEIWVLATKGVIWRPNKERGWELQVCVLGRANAMELSEEETRDGSLGGVDWRDMFVL